ncbi:hypothetical protein [Pseudosulfitobacter sp. SM2401]|uniref:hypothetical protein n=1 Tax=Pseudosulfitobacter sp. SM2401 TaxID=3350098 RepID=UPI0036F39D39
MGQPYHYGINLPERCLQLIDGLWDQAQNVHGNDRPELGPLTSTFLISMAMPIINLPIERIERQIDKPPGYADDRHISEDTVQAFIDVIRKGSFAAAPFCEDSAWSFANVREQPFFNTADGIPNNIAEYLGGDEAREAARNMPASQWISILRNALAHGGVAYLDENGRRGHDSPVKMYAFVSGKYGRLECKNGEGKCPSGLGDLEGLNVLRIKETDFRSFLTKWVDWLRVSHIAAKA